jgi:hypothetical protein
VRVRAAVVVTASVASIATSSNEGDPVALVASSEPQRFNASPGETLTWLGSSLRTLGPGENSGAPGSVWVLRLTDDTVAATAVTVTLTGSRTQSVTTFPNDAGVATTGVFQYCIEEPCVDEVTIDLAFPDSDAARRIPGGFVLEVQTLVCADRGKQPVASLTVEVAADD